MFKENAYQLKRLSKTGHCRESCLVFGLHKLQDSSMVQKDSRWPFFGQVDMQSICCISFTRARNKNIKNQLLITYY